MHGLYISLPTQGVKMQTITIDVPDALTERLATHKERIAEILALGLDELSPVPNEVYRYVLAFLASNPSDETLINFRPTPQMQDRMNRLLAREKTHGLKALEQAKLDEYERIEHFIVLLKAHTPLE
jgi:hypothetical protein